MILSTSIPHKGCCSKLLFSPTYIKPIWYLDIRRSIYIVLLQQQQQQQQQQQPEPEPQPQPETMMDIYLFKDVALFISFIRGWYHLPTSYEWFTENTGCNLVKPLVYITYNVGIAMS